MQKKNHIHITGICGVATSALAIAFHEQGYKVTGSDKGFYPPVSTNLSNAGISFYAGWHPEKMCEFGNPDFVIAGTASGSHNPETEYAKNNNIPILSDAEVRGKYFAKNNSIVCAGTWGKTSSTALLSHILVSANMDPSYVIGGVSLSTPSAHIGASDWSVIEGDEYKSSPWDNSPKFSHLKTTHLLLTAVSWDHADLYPTEESYFQAFDRLVHSIPPKGLIIANTDHFGVSRTLSHSRAKIVKYGTKDADYTYSRVSQSKQGLNFFISHNGFSYEINTTMIGTFQAENITGCFAMAHEIGIPATKIIEAISTFKGMKRRLERRYEGEYFVFDDIAHSAEKAFYSLENIRTITKGQITAIFEPNIGGRRRESQSKYDKAFIHADRVIIPKLTRLKINQDESAQPMEGRELADVISKTHKNVEYIEDDKVLVDSIVNSAKPGDTIIFLSAHGFRGMIEDTVNRLYTKENS